MIEGPRPGDPRGGAPDEQPLPGGPAFLRFDRPEIEDGSMVVRAVPADVRARRRQARGTPLAYLYEVVSPWEPEHDLSFTAGHYDETRLVWRFSGEVTGIAGITEPSATEPSATGPSTADARPGPAPGTGPGSGSGPAPP